MNTFWIAHQASLIVFLAVILLIALSNLVILKRMRLGRYPEPKRLPRVSIMVPARNEEHNIGACVESLLAQDYADFEVLVADDNSTDRTWETLERLKRESPQLKIMKGKPLPEGWLGKHWACHQMAEKALGELLLFTDADTRHHPCTLRDAVAALTKENADLLTALPREEVFSFGERLIVPLMHISILSFLPLFIAYRVRWPALSAAGGQFMLFRRETYQQVGGFESVRTNPVDDIDLGRRMKAQGLRWRLADGQDRVSCRMYQGFSESFKGFGKSLFAAFDRNIPVFLFVWLWMGVLFWEPGVVFALRIAGAGISDLSLALAAAAVGVSLILWGTSLRHFRFPLYLTLLYPISILLGVVIAFYSMIATLSGRALWKGRRVGMRN